MPIVVRYKRLYAFTLGAMGLSQLLLGVVRAGRDLDPSQQLLLGAFGLVLSYMLFNTPWLKLQDNRVQVGGLFGVGGRKFEFKSTDDLALDGSNLLVNTGKEWHRIQLGKSFAHSADWAHLEAWVSRRETR